MNTGIMFPGVSVSEYPRQAYHAAPRLLRAALWVDGLLSSGAVPSSGICSASGGARLLARKIIVETFVNATTMCVDQ
jgi:hypothetical protein